MVAHRHNFQSRGFSLVELLVVISVIAVLASLAIPSLGSVTANAHYAKNERNAQTVASLLSAAKAAGATNSWDSVESALTDLEETIVIPVGNSTVDFHLDPLAPDDRAALTNFLMVSDGMIYYQPPN